MADNYTPRHQVGETVEGGKYRLDQFLGAGTFGEVWRAVQIVLGAPVAIKLMHWQITNVDSRDRFLDEARVSIALGKHANIVGGRDLIMEGEMPCIVMEYIDGGLNLRKYFGDGELIASDREALRITAGILRGLIHAHENGVLHRDLKPENVLMNPATDPITPMVGDFGLAGTSNGTSEGAPRRTLAGQKFGTPGYIPFEQWNNALDATPRSDLYAVGVMLAEMVGVDPIANSLGTINDSIIPEKRREWLARIASSRIRVIVERATAIEWFQGVVHARRYENARAMLEAVEAAMAQASVEDPPRQRRPTEVVPAERRVLPAGATAVPSLPLEAVPPPNTDEGRLRYGTFIDDDPIPSRKWWWIGGATVALVVIVVVAVLWPRGKEEKVEIPEGEVTKVATPDEIESNASSPKEPDPPTPPAVVEAPKLDVPKVVRVEPVPDPPVAEVAPPPIEPLSPEPPKPPVAKVTTASVAITNPTTSVNAEGQLSIEAKVSVPEGTVVKSVTLRYYGSTGGAKLSKGMTFDGNVAKTTITVPAALGATMTYYVDVRTEDNLGTPIKSGTITATITQ